jgi:hypothetical protein
VRAYCAGATTVLQDAYAPVTYDTPPIEAGDVVTLASAYTTYFTFGAALLTVLPVMF